MNNRYYDPEIGRFINSDHPAVFAIDLGNVIQYNMYTYCLNNPINNYDPNGLWTFGLSLNANFNIFVGCSVGIGLDLGAGITAQVTDSDTVYGLYGPTTYIGASGGPLWYIGGDVLSFSEVSDTKAKINGAQITGGVGIGVDIHVTQTNTKKVGKTSILKSMPINIAAIKISKKSICSDKKSLNKVTIKWG